MSLLSGDFIILLSLPASRLSWDQLPALEFSSLKYGCSFFFSMDMRWMSGTLLKCCPFLLPLVCLSNVSHSRFLLLLVKRLQGLKLFISQLCQIQSNYGSKNLKTLAGLGYWRPCLKKEDK